MMLATVEEEKPPAAQSKPNPTRGIDAIRKHKSRRPKRAEILDLQEATRERIKKCNGNNQEFVALIRAWSELESLLQSYESKQFNANGAKLPKVAKSLSAVAEDDPAAGTQATDPKV